MLDKILNNAGIDDRIKIIKIHYALEVIKSEVGKLMIFCVTFIFLGLFREFLFCCLILLPIRAFSGGMHMKTNMGCFLYSGGVFALSIKILPLLPIPMLLLFVPFIAASLTIAVLSPIESYKRPIKSLDRRIALKKNVWFFLTADFAILMIFYCVGNQALFVIGVWVILLQAAQLLATYGYRKRKGGSNENLEKNQSVETNEIGDIGRRSCTCDNR